MATPRHGMGAAAIGEWIYVAGGGPVQGGGSRVAITRRSRWRKNRDRHSFS
jgi:hypothetical protein